MSRPVRPHDIIYSTHYNTLGEKFNHYFYCIYTRSQDDKTSLKKDLVGLYISTKKPKHNYYVDIEINGTNAYVICDHEYLFIDSKIVVKNLNSLTVNKRKVIKVYKRVVKEKIRQMGGKY